MSDRALVRNTSDRSQVRKAKKTERQQKIEEQGNLESVLTTYDGRALLWRILSRCHPKHTSHRGEETHSTSFQEGERNIGLWLEAVICEADLSAYQMMQTEAAKRADNVVEPPVKSDEPFPLSEPTEQTATIEDDDGN